MKNKVIVVCLKAMFQQLSGRNEHIDENHLKRKIVVRIGDLETEIQTRNLTDS
jgi:hypothetical protein